MHFAKLIAQFSLMALGQWGYPIVLLFSVAEASPVFGVFIPGATVVMAAGFFAKIGLLQLGWVMALSSLGAVAGDLGGYLLGSRYGHPFLTRYGKYFLLKESAYQKTQKLMHEHTGKTLVIGRFNALTRSLAPFVAGASRVPFSKFLFFDLIAGAGWGISHALIGYLFGQSFGLVSHAIGKFIGVAIVLSLVIIYGYRFMNKKWHLLSKIYRYDLLLNLASLYLFAKMTDDVVKHQAIIQWDRWVNAKIILWQQPALIKLMTGITNIVSPGHLILFSLLLLAALALRKKWHNCLLLILSLGGGLLSETIIKWIVHRPRPGNALLDLTGYSFPSGHATMAIIFFSLLLYSFKDDIKNKVLRGFFIAANILLFLLIGFSRIYLNVHWLSDVIGGFALGLFWLTIFILIFKYIGFFSQKVAAFWKDLTH